MTKFINKTMKILSVIFPMPFSPIKDDAMLWRILNIKELLEMNGHKVDLVYYTPRYLYKKTNAELNEEISVKITHIPPLKHLKILKENNYDLVYGNTPWSTFWSILGKSMNIPLVLDMHGLPAEEFLLYKKIKNPYDISSILTLKFAEKMSIKYSDKIIVVSKRMMKYLYLKRQVPKEKIVYIPNGVNLDFFKPPDVEKINELKTKFGLENKFIFGYIGGFQKWQGAENFIEAARRIKDKNLIFLIVGGTKELQEDNLIFYPYAHRSQIIMYYSICDVLVLPRPRHVVTEVAAPTKFAEYASMGKPILSTDVGDASDLIKKYKCGIVIEDNSIKKLMAGIYAFKQLPTEDLENMGKNSRKLAEKEFDWNKIGHTLKEVL